MLQLVEDTFEERKERLLEMYKYFEDRMVVEVVKEEFHYCCWWLCQSCSSCG